MTTVDKKLLIESIRDMPDDATKRGFIVTLLTEGTLTEQDIAAIVIDVLEQDIDRLADSIREDQWLRFVWERFRDYPQYLARALARLRPDLFYTYGLAFRVVLRLRADLGPVVIPPHRPGDEEPRGVEPRPELPAEVTQDLFALDVECRFRELLYYFSQSTAEGIAILENEIRRAEDYDRRVLEAVRTLIMRLLALELPGVVGSLNDRAFPALHVRWWLDRIREVPRSLNIGDTGAYKTAFAAIEARRAGCQRILVLCPPHARGNWRRELAMYFTTPPTVEVIERGRDLRRFRQPDVDCAEFTIVGWATLAGRGAVECLLAGGFDCLIVDECHYGKGVTGTVAARAARAVAHARLARELPLQRYLALSATPAENGPHEFAAIAVALRPDLFPTVESFLRSGAGQSPRFLRELFGDQILEIELREVRDLPQITPKPWEDLFGAVPLEMQPNHRTIYQFVHDSGPEEDDEEPADDGDAAEDPEGTDDEGKNGGLRPAQKALRLLQAGTHPHLVEGHFDWPDALRAHFRDWRLSTKLVWLKKFIEERIDQGKIVVGSGLFADGITRVSDDAETAWVGRLLREWFGEDRVLILDGTVSTRRNDGGESPRDALIRRWRTDPTARVLLVSTQACPDSVNLTIPKHDTVEKLWVTALSFGWKPWKQFLGRFWREGQGVPVEYRVPILIGTIEEDLLGLLEEKWRVQQLFRAQVPLEERELGVLRRGTAEQLRRLLRSSADQVARITSMMRGRGEEGCVKAYRLRSGVRTNAELWAEHFARIQEHAGSGHISRFVSKTIDRLIAEGLLADDRCFDAGCGPLTMARRRGKPWHSVDMCVEMIDMGRTLAPHLAANAHVGFLSELPEEWTGTFDLTVASLALHFSTLRPLRQREPERCWILRQLLRVTHPHGLLWLNFNEGYHTQETFRAWVDGLARSGCAVVPALTGLVRATDADPKRPFRFWSIVVSPNGCAPTFAKPQVFRFPFECARGKVIDGTRRDRRDLPPPDLAKRRTLQEFEVENPSTRTVIRDDVAATNAARSELERWCRAVDRGQQIGRLLTCMPQSIDPRDWRTWTKLRERGLLPT